MRVFDYNQFRPWKVHILGAHRFTYFIQIEHPARRFVAVQGIELDPSVHSCTGIFVEKGMAVVGGDDLEIFVLTVTMLVYFITTAHLWSITKIQKKSMKSQEKTMNNQRKINEKPWKNQWKIYENPWKNQWQINEKSMKIHEKSMKIHDKSKKNQWKINEHP